MSKKSITSTVQDYLEENSSYTDKSGEQVDIQDSGKLIDLLGGNKKQNKVKGVPPSGEIRKKLAALRAEFADRAKKHSNIRESAQYQAILEKSISVLEAAIARSQGRSEKLKEIVKIQEADPPPTDAQQSAIPGTPKSLRPQEKTSNKSARALRKWMGHR
jgi:hypothetical protein